MSSIKKLAHLNKAEGSKLNAESKKGHWVIGKA
jgi:hypothetical protein